MTPRPQTPGTLADVRVVDAALAPAVGSEGLWRRFTVADPRELTGELRYATNRYRVCNRSTLVPLIEKHLAARGCSQWTAILNDAGVPAGPVNAVPRRWPNGRRPRARRSSSWTTRSRERSRSCARRAW